MDSIQDLSNFVVGLQGKGMVLPSTAVLTRAALSKVAEVFEAGDALPSIEDLASVEQVEVIFRRHLTKFQGKLKPDSAKRYISAVVKAGENYLAHLKDPINYKPTFQQASLGAEEKPKKPKASTTAPKTVVTKSEAGNVSSASPEQSDGTSGQSEILTRFPVRSDYVWKAPVPRGLKQAEVLKFAYHLLTYCEDWDPRQPFWQQPAPEATATLPRQA